MTLRDAGLALVRRLPFLGPVARFVYNRAPSALHDTPTTFLKDLFSGANTIQFIQIGAFDGVAGDPIRPLVTTDARWRGIMVEPQPKVFTRLCANYSAQADRLTFLPCAVAAARDARPFYYIPETEVARLALPDWAGEVASFDRDHVQKHFPEARVEEVATDIITFADAAERLSHVDLVVMDVEGFERPILNAIEWDRFGVQACLFEHKHMPPAELAEIDGLLARHGFAWKRYGRDTLAYRSRIAEA